MKSTLKILLLLIGLGVSFGSSKAQQLPLIGYQLYHPEMFNPGYLPRVPLAQIAFGWQQRQLANPGWRKVSQYLYYKAKPLGRNQNFGWGAYGTNDVEHTERRISLGASVSGALLNTERTYFSVGFNIGLVNWFSNYSSFRIYDRTDDLVVRPVNLTDLDAGLGFSFGYENFVMRAKADAFIAQLPGSLLSGSSPGLTIFPHGFGTGMILFSPYPDIFVGPVVNYRNIYSSDANVTYIGGAAADAGLRVDFDRPGLWVGAGWRLDNAAVTAGFGLKIVDTDTLDSRRAQNALFSELNFVASYPLNESSLFGPTIEIGLKASLGRVGDDGPRIDTIGLMKGAFWLNNGNINTHRQRRLDATSPDELVAESLVGEKYVDLSYYFDDNQYQYVGENLELYSDSTIIKLGGDWIGMDAILENMVGEVVTEALKPTFQGVEDPDSVEVLKDLLAVRVGSRLKFDLLSAQFGAEGLRYNGEFGADNNFTDTLTIPFIYEKRDYPVDTFVKVVKGQLVTNLELAALKLHAMDLKLEYELQKFYGEKYEFVRDGDGISGGKIVNIDKPYIIPNNPNQKPFSRGIVEVSFLRDPEWEPETTTGRSSKTGDSKNKRGRNRIRQSRKERDRFREDVGGSTDD